jgi:hypothetical protein
LDRANAVISSLAGLVGDMTAEIYDYTEGRDDNTW